ncbi:MAG: tRNA (guanosine(37)-N1)-methyltransferase TrmD [Elusimicrobia bacterium]|nr:tRNA (guanosine(37)-N1)-methyltransferase TrmD [Elusimicrobiota bacterium]
MKIDILTIFPEYFESPLKCSLLKKAIDRKIIEINTINIRDFSPDGRVDDKPFGGGAGMVLKVEPIYKAIKSIETPHSQVIVLSPRGEKFNSKIARELSEAKHLIFVCGRYEGIDQRVCDIFSAREISLGEFVLSGGEAAALAIIEAVARLIPGFMGNPESLKEESFMNGEVEYPQYTRPGNFMGYKVPEVLLSGNHKKIKQYRQMQKRKVCHEEKV